MHCLIASGFMCFCKEQINHFGNRGEAGAVLTDSMEDVDRELQEIIEYITREA
jgi:hypothetical protein